MTVKTTCPLCTFPILTKGLHDAVQVLVAVRTQVIVKTVLREIALMQPEQGLDIEQLTRASIAALRTHKA